MADPRVGDWVLVRKIPHLSSAGEAEHPTPQWVRIVDDGAEGTDRPGVHHPAQADALRFSAHFARVNGVDTNPLGFGLTNIVHEDELTDDQLAERARLYLMGEGS